jgi:purine-binding chemotaxis protein CheW
MTVRQYATFHVAGQFFGIDVAHVQEVLRFAGCTRLPLAPPAVRGLINLRGQVITALDLRVRLGLPPRTEDDPVTVVIRVDDDVVSLLVDAIDEVLELSDEEFEPLPETVAGPARELVTGACPLEGRLLLALDVRRAVESIETQRAGAGRQERR